MTKKNIFGLNVFGVYFDFLVCTCRPANMEGEGFKTCTTTSQQRAIKMFWLHF